MSSFENTGKTELCFRRGSVRLAAVELCARNDTSMEPRLRTNDVLISKLFILLEQTRFSAHIH